MSDSPAADQPSSGAVPTEKKRRKAKANRESGLRLQRADSQNVNLEAVDPKYQKLAASIAANPKGFDGQFHWLIEDPGVLRTENSLYFVAPKLADCRRVDFYTGFALKRKVGQFLPVVLYVRVSSESQALYGVSMQGMVEDQFAKAAAIGLRIVGIAIDVETATLEKREALDKVMAQIHSKLVRTIVVPVISRLDRNERNFANRMATLEDCESWVYYGAFLDSADYDYVNWAEKDSRQRAVNQVREDEFFIKNLKANISSSDRTKARAGKLISALKKDNMLLHVAPPVNGDLAERPIAKRPDCDAEYIRMKAAILGARDAKDPKILTTYLTEAGARIGQEVTLDDFDWEFRLGLIIGLNRRSPNVPVELAVRITTLAVESDDKVYKDLLQAYDEVRDLMRRNRTNRLASDDLPDDVKARLAEHQAARGRRIRYRLTCDCAGQLKEVVRVGKIDDEQDFAVCPRCSPGGKGAPGKTRQPNRNDLRHARNMPPERCIGCGRYSDVRIDVMVRVDDVQFPVYRCTKCTRQKWLGAPKFPMPASAGPEASNPFPSANPAPSASTHDSTHSEQAVEPAEGKPESPKKRHSLPLPVWDLPLPAAQPADASALSPTTAAMLRVGNLLLHDQGMHAFPVAMLRSFALEGIALPPDRLLDVWTEAQRGLRKRLARCGYRMQKGRLAGLQFAVWVDPIPGAPRLPAMTETPQSSPLTSTAMLPSNPFPTETPEGFPREPWLSEVPAAQSQHEILTAMPMARRMAAVLAEHGLRYCFTTAQIRCVAIGGELRLEVPKKLRQAFNHAVANLHEVLDAKGFVLRTQRIPHSFHYWFWAEEKRAEMASEAGEVPA